MTTEHDLDKALALEPPEFAAAVKAVVTGNVDTLGALLAQNPALVYMRSAASHHAELLHYVASNGVQAEFQLSSESIYNQCAACDASERPALQKRALDVAQLLIDAGAVVMSTCDLYGGESDVMGLLVSSAHPDSAEVQTDLVRLLVKAGFPVNGIRDDGAPMAMALGSGYWASAETLRQLGARVDNLQFAAGLGRADDVARFFDSNGTVLLGAMFESKTGESQFATGYLSLTHSTNTSAVVQQALVLACMYDNLDAVRALLAGGADPMSRDPDFNKTALEWSTAFNEGDVADYLRAL
jgi:hypothetical protein